jgi:hypothetical protein
MQPRRGTGFTNVSQMLRANQSNRLGSIITGGIQQQTQRAQSGIQQAQDKFQQESEKNRLDSQANLERKEQTLGNISPGFAPQSGQQQPTTQPTQPQQEEPPQMRSNMQDGFQAGTTGGRSDIPAQPAPQSNIKSDSDLISDDDISFFAKLRAGQYEGPRGLEDSNMLVNRALNAEQTGQLARSAGGREELLRRFVGGQDYTGGQRRMDQTILSQDRNVNLGGAAREARGTVDKLIRAEDAASSTGRDLEARAQEFAQRTGERLGQAFDPLSIDLDKRIAAQKEVETQRAAQIKQIQDRLKAPTNIKEFRDDQKFVQQESIDLAKYKPKKWVADAGNGIGGFIDADPNDPEARYVTDKSGPFSNIHTELTPAQYNQRQTALQQKQSQLAQIQQQNPDMALSDVDRARAGLQQALQSGLLTQDQMNEMMELSDLAGTDFDLASALSERLSTIGPQNLTRTGFATDEDRARMTALQRLMGKQGTDLEFSANDPRFQTTRATADVSNLRDFLTGLKNRQPGQPIDVGSANADKAEYAKYLTEAALLYATPGLGIVDRLTGGNIVSTISNPINRATRGWRISDENKKESISYDPKDVEKFMGRLKASSYNYKPEIQDSPLASKNREIGVMAQDLEKSKLGKESVKNTPNGKIVDYDNLGPKMLASIANLNERLKKMEKQ